jgi:hypothetical protein
MSLICACSIFLFDNLSLFFINLYSGGGATTSKAKKASVKSSQKSKDSGKSDRKSKDSKSLGKSEHEVGGKFKDHSSKAGGKSIY